MLHFWNQEKFRRCQVRTVRRMLEDVPMELLMQQGLVLPGSMRMCTVVQQKNSTRELPSSARWPKISLACIKLKHLVPHSRRDSQSDGHSCLCTYHVTRSDVELHDLLFNITLNTRSQWSAATKPVRGLYAQTFFTFWMPFVHKHCTRKRKSSGTHFIGG